MPEANKAYKMISCNVREWLETRAGYTLKLARKIYSNEKHPALTIRRIYGLMNLEKKYSPEQFEKACEYVIIHHPTYRHRSLQSILKLRSMAKAYEEQQSMEGIKNFTFEDRLGMMLDREVVARSNRRLDRGLGRQLLNTKLPAWKILITEVSGTSTDH